MDALCEEQTIFVTNNSSSQVSEIAAATNREDRFCGLHFFIHVPLMDLVEMTFLAETSERIRDTIESFVERIGKTVIRVADMIGLNTMLNIQQALYEKTKKEKYKVLPLLIEMAEQNLLGRKTGKGFYEH